MTEAELIKAMEAEGYQIHCERMPDGSYSWDATQAPLPDPAPPEKPEPDVEIVLGPRGYGKVAFQAAPYAITPAMVDAASRVAWVADYRFEFGMDDDERMRALLAELVDAMLATSPMPPEVTP